MKPRNQSGGQSPLPPAQRRSCNPCPKKIKEMAELRPHQPEHRPREALGRDEMRRDEDSVSPGVTPCSQGCCCQEPRDIRAGCGHTEVTTSYHQPTALSFLKKNIFIQQISYKQVSPGLNMETKRCGSSSCGFAHLNWRCPHLNIQSGLMLR